MPGACPSTPAGASEVRLEEGRQVSEGSARKPELSAESVVREISDTLPEADLTDEFVDRSEQRSRPLPASLLPNPLCAFEACLCDGQHHNPLMTCPEE